jgi:hypothetical protein
VAAADLVSLEDVRAQLQLQTTETELDDVVGPLITSYSTAIASYCGRQFAPAEDVRDAPVPAAPGRPPRRPVRPRPRAV